MSVAAFPLCSIVPEPEGMLTAKVDAVVQGLYKLRSHFSIEVMTLVQLELPVLQCCIHQVVQSLLIQCVQDIAQPRLVNVQPVLFTWQVPEQ